MASPKRIKKKLEVLKGGARPRVVEISERGVKLGGGCEGVIHKVEVGLSGKRITMAEKESTLPAKEYEGGFGDIAEQFRTMQRLRRVNRKEKIGLRIMPTIRLREREGKEPTLIITRLKIPSLINPSGELKRQYQADRKMQIDTAKKHGFLLRGHNFFPQIDPKTNKVVAMICDFGGIKVRK